MHFSSRLLIAALVVLLHAPMGHAQTESAHYWQPTDQYRLEFDNADSEVPALIARWDRIGEELKLKQNSFAGTYEKRGYRGWLLRWAPQSGFVFIYHSEGLSIIDFSFGKVRATPSEILFEPEREMNRTFRDTKLATPRKWIPIGSTTASYLIAEAEIKAFSNYVGGFGKYNAFNGPFCDFDPFFLMQKQEQVSQSKVTSLVIPADFEPLIKSPITGRIVSVGRKRLVRNYSLRGDLYFQLFPSVSLTPVVLSVGARQGVRKNQLFRLVGEPDQQYVKVVSVNREKSSAVVIRDRDDNGKENYFPYLPGSGEPQPQPFPPIHAGIKVTTSPILDF